jgi:hypothetical protein
MSLDDLYEIMSWKPIAELDPVRLSVRVQVTRVVLTIRVKALLNGRLDREAARERDRVASSQISHASFLSGDAARRQLRESSGHTPRLARKLWCLTPAYSRKSLAKNHVPRNCP